MSLTIYLARGWPGRIFAARASPSIRPQLQKLLHHPLSLLLFMAVSVIPNMWHSRLMHFRVISFNQRACIRFYPEHIC